MQDTPKRNTQEPSGDIYVREGGPYAGLIRELVESGRYGSTAEVILDALSLLRDREFARKAGRDWLRAEIQKGIDSADRGELIPAEDVFSSLRAELQALADKKCQ